MCVEFWWLRTLWHHFHTYQTIRRPLVSPRWVLKKTISNRIEKVHQRIKVITRNNCVLIRADPHSKGGHRGCSNRASDLPQRRGQGFSFNYHPSAHCTLCLGSSWTFNTCMHRLHGCIYQLLIYIFIFHAWFVFLQEIHSILLHRSLLLFFCTFSSLRCVSCLYSHISLCENC